jgi:hypothetical protein
MRRHTIEPPQPLVKPAVVAGHILHVHGAAHALPDAEIDVLMRDALLPGKRLIRPVGVGHQQGVGSEHRAQMFRQLSDCHGAPSSDEVNRIAAPVTRNKDAHLLFRNATFRRLAASLTCRPLQVARAFLRFKEKRFIGLGDPVQAGGMVGFREAEKAVAPAQARVPGDPTRAAALRTVRESSMHSLKSSHYPCGAGGPAAYRSGC